MRDNAGAMASRLLRLLTWLCLALLPLCAAAAKPPDATGLLMDQTGTLEEAVARDLLIRLQGIQASGRAQVGILLAKDTQGEALADFSLQVASHWKLGHAGKDDGLLVVLVPSTPAARIEVGYGLEGAIPDVRAAEWIDEMLPQVKAGTVPTALHQLLDRIEASLPAEAARDGPMNILDRHPEWKLPFVFVIFSPFALFPLFMGRWGALASAPLFCGFIPAAAWNAWHSEAVAAGAGAIAFLLPLLWSLNARRDEDLPQWMERSRDAGNLAAVAIMFALLATFFAVGFSGHGEAVGAGLLFALTMSLGLAAVLFPGEPARVMLIVLRSLMHFLLVLAISYPALHSIVAQPALVAFIVSACVTALIAMALFLEHKGSKRAALWLVGLALLILLPVGLLLVVQAALGEDFHSQLMHLAAGGGSIGGALWWAARHGFFVALKIGLGGRFGGGGAEGRG